MNIKFRCWDKQDKKFVRVASLNFISHGDLLTVLVKENGIEYIKPVSDVVLMQSTGLKDRNGRDVYDGDVCIHKDTDTDFKYFVRWIKEYARFAFTNADGNELLANVCFMQDFKVIGNVYENLNLLKGTKKCQ